MADMTGSRFMSAILLISEETVVYGHTTQNECPIQEKEV